MITQPSGRDRCVFVLDVFAPVCFSWLYFKSLKLVTIPWIYHFNRQTLLFSSKCQVKFPTLVPTQTDSFHSIVYSIIPVQLWGQLFRAFSHPANKNVGINWILVIFGMYIVKYFGIKSLPFKLCLNDQYWPWQSHVRRTQIQPLIWLHFGKVPSTLQHKVVCCVPATLLAKTNLYSHSFRFNIKANKFNTTRPC